MIVRQVLRGYHSKSSFILGKSLVVCDRNEGLTGSICSIVVELNSQQRLGLGGEKVALSVRETAEEKEHSFA